MDESSGLRRRLRGKVARKALAYFLVALMVILFAASFPHILPMWLSKICMLFFEIILAILILWAVFAFQIKPQGSYITDRYPDELDRLAEIYENQGDKALQQDLFNLPYIKPFYLEELYPLSADRFLEECAKRREIAANDELRLVLLAKKAIFEIRADNFVQARECLWAALSIDPHAFILWLRLAEVSERLGARDEAISAYERALEEAPENRQVKEYLQAQIRLVRTQGPRKELPMQGFRYH